MDLRKRGFTLVELLIVIVVIAILAAITVVAYNGVQDRARASLVRDSLAKKAKQLEIDKVERGEFVASIDDLAEMSSAGSSVSFQYTREGTGSESDFCLTGILGNITQYIRNGNTEAQDGACEGHDDPNLPPPEVTYQSVQKFSEPGATTPVEVSHTIDFDLQPSDLVFVVYDINFYTHIHGVEAGTTAFEHVYRKSMGASGYQQIVAYKGSGMSGPQTLITGACYGGYSQSACYAGSTVTGEYIVYVIRGKSNPTVVYSDTSFGSQTAGAAVSPAPQDISPNDVAIFAYVYYGNNLPTVVDGSSPQLAWTVDTVKTRATAQVGGEYDALSTSRITATESGTVAPTLQMPSSGATYAGATLFVIK